MASKRLIICCDGTWNDADSGSDFTNVVRIARAIKAFDDRSDTEQVVYYQSGIGSEGDSLMHAVDGGTGLGLSRNVRDAYAFIAHNYCDGDELFLFGFSRGAYTARSVAGLIGWAGVVHKGDMDDFALLWESFKTRTADGFQDARPFFPDRHAAVTITCVGVWDTVGALGIPGHLNVLLKKLYEFQDTALGNHVQNAFHALAIDEHRTEFVPTLWHKPADAPVGQRLEQVWFAGAHSNIGGGYDEHGLSDVALAWMADRVGGMLAIDDTYLLARQDRTDGWALSKIYDSSAGLTGLFGRTNRDIAKGTDTNEAVHASVGVRLAADAAANGGVYNPAAFPEAGRAAVSNAAFGLREVALRWTAAGGQTGKTTRPAPQATDRIMKTLRI